MQRTRAWRRHQRERIKNKRIRQINSWWFGERVVDDPKFVGMMIDTPHPCSGPCCGNPRKHFGLLTRQEIIAGEVE